MAHALFAYKARTQAQTEANRARHGVAGLLTVSRCIPI